MWSTFLRYAFDIVGQSVSALRDNRLRTALSMSGIAIGVTAVMAISTVSKGGRDSIFAELETFGSFGTTKTRTRFATYARAVVSTPVTCMR